jgi:6-pyruvoyl tetrahydropterin synthase/QueD family protein
VKCLECGKDFKSISNTHLLKCCGLTIKEYAIKNCIPIETLFSECHRNSVKLNSEQMAKANQKRTEMTRNKQIQTLTYEESQIIIGSLLGNGYFFRGQNKNSIYLILEQEIVQLNYLLWKGSKLSRLGAKFYQYYRYNPVKNRYTTYNQIRTQNLYIFGNLIEYFYNSTGKYINSEILEYVDPLALAIWFMDDGTHPEGLTWGSLATQSFSKSDNELIADFLKTKFNIGCRIAKDAKNMSYIFFNKEQFKQLSNIIEPHIFYQMGYKIGKVPLPECILSKRVIFDSSHFLDEYNGKCSNLHGGRYELWVSVKGPIDPRTGMVLDYGYMKTVLDKYIVELFDHHCLNYSVAELGWRSTTELICIYIWKVLIEFFPNLYKIELHETEGSKCEYSGPSLSEMKHDKTLDILNTFQEKDTKWRERIIIEFKDLFSNVDFESEDINIGNYKDLSKTSTKLIKLSQFLKNV